jgi:hypothetical protein
MTAEDLPVTEMLVLLLSPRDIFSIRYWISNVGCRSSYLALWRWLLLCDEKITGAKQKSRFLFIIKIKKLGLSFTTLGAQQATFSGLSNLQS